MFIRYMNGYKAVNLDNFDYIQMCTENLLDSESYNVVAVKVQPRIETSNIGRGGNVHSSGRGEYIIKSFVDKKEAISFYEKLQYGFINRIDVFEVD